MPFFGRDPPAEGDWERDVEVATLGSARNVKALLGSPGVGEGAAARAKVSQMPFPTKQTTRGRWVAILRRRAGTPSVNSVLWSSAAWGLCENRRGGG